MVGEVWRGYPKCPGKPWRAFYRTANSPSECFESKFCPSYQEDSTFPGTRTEGGTEKRDYGWAGARSRQRQAKTLPRGFSLVPADPVLPPRQPASAKKSLEPLKNGGTLKRELLGIRGM